MWGDDLPRHDGVRHVHRRRDHSDSARPGAFGGFVRVRDGLHDGELGQHSYRTDVSRRCRRDNVVYGAHRVVNALPQAIRSSRFFDSAARQLVASRIWSSIRMKLNWTPSLENERMLIFVPGTSRSGGALGDCIGAQYSVIVRLHAGSEASCHRFSSRTSPSQRGLSLAPKKTQT